MQPEVSILIPFRNEKRRIVRCLESLLASSYSLEKCEVIFINGNSTDSSDTIVSERMFAFPHAVLLNNKQACVPSSLNLALRVASGRIILRMDAHCEYPIDYVESCLSELERTGAGNVGGVLLTRPGKENWVSRCIGLLSQHRLAVGNSAFRLGQGSRFVDTVPFGAFRREVFDVIGPFREDLQRNQDYELNSRLRSAGYKLFLSSRIRITYYNSSNIMDYFRQACVNGHYAVRSWFINRSSFCWRHATPMAFVLAGSAMVLLSIFDKTALILTSILVLAYALVIIYVGISLAFRQNWRFAILAPPIICGYHVCYGFSTLLEGIRTTTSFLGNAVRHSDESIFN